MPAYICIDFNFTKISAKHGRPKYILTPEKQATFNMVTSYYLQNSLETVERAHDFFFPKRVFATSEIGRSRRKGHDI